MDHRLWSRAAVVGGPSAHPPEFAGQRADRRRAERHIGVTGEGVHIIRSLLRNSPTHPLVPILTGLIFAFVGSIALVGSLQVLYERTFDQQPRGWRDIPRFVVWLVVLLGALTVEGIISQPVLTTTGPVIEGLVRFLAAMLFFWWTMHFLLAGRTPWRVLVRPALVTATLARSCPLLFDQPLSHHRLGQQAVRNHRRRLHSPDLVHSDRHGPRPRRDTRCRLAKPKRSRVASRRLRRPPEQGGLTRTRAAPEASD
jgi:hypothetical protein